MKMSKSAEYAINWLHHCGKSVDEICEELKLSNKQVTSYLEKHFTQNETDKLATKSSPVHNKLSSKELMIRHTRDKKTNSVAIMTKEASQINDSLRPSLNQSIKNKDCIFNPNK